MEAQVARGADPPGHRSKSRQSSPLKAKAERGESRAQTSWLREGAWDAKFSNLSRLVYLLEAKGVDGAGTLPGTVKAEQAARENEGIRGVPRPQWTST
jgi:hypothetical protein